MARRARGSSPRIRFVDFHEYEANARRWKVMRSLVAPTEEAKDAGAFAIVVVGGREEWLVYVG